MLLTPSWGEMNRRPLGSTAIETQEPSPACAERSSSILKPVSVASLSTGVALPPSCGAESNPTGDATAVRRISASNFRTVIDNQSFRLRPRLRITSREHMGVEEAWARLSFQAGARHVVQRSFPERRHLVRFAADGCKPKKGAF